MISVHTILSILPSLFVFLMGSFFFLRTGLPKPLKLVATCLLALLLLMSNLHLIADSLSGNGIDESVIFHLRHGVDGAGFKGFYKLYIFGTLSFAASIAILFFFYKNLKTTSQLQRSRFACGTALLVLAFALHPTVGDSLALVRNSAIIGAQSATNQNEVHGFGQLYEAPSITPKLKTQPNIVYIYAESFERTYFNQSIFPDLIQNLRKWEKRSINFTNIRQVAGTGWTIAGMVASQCGIPLVTTGSNGNSMGAMDQFLPGATCLGELLNRAGYQLAYRGGADLSFAGKGKFYKAHGFTDVKGFHEMKDELQDQSYRTGWGLYDDTTFDIAYNDFLSLSEKKKPFGLFMLTLDTHHPEGHMPKRCESVRYGDGSNPILNAVSCSDKLIGEFLDRIAASPYADNTLVVVASDHFAMPNTARDQLESAERRNMLFIIPPGRQVMTEMSRAGSTLDIGPTLLHVLTGHPHSIGLGRSLLATSELNLVERLGDSVDQQLNDWRPSILQLWDVPDLKQGVKIKPNDQLVSLGNRNLQFPMLIDLDQDLGIKEIWFPDIDESIKQRVANNRDVRGIWIDYCKDMDEIEENLPAQTFCLLVGSIGTKQFQIEPLLGDLDLSLDTIRERAYPMQ